MKTVCIDYQNKDCMPKVYFLFGLGLVWVWLGLTVAFILRGRLEESLGLFRLLLNSGIMVLGGHRLSSVSNDCPDPWFSGQAKVVFITEH